MFFLLQLESRPPSCGDQIHRRRRRPRVPPPDNSEPERASPDPQRAVVVGGKPVPSSLLLLVVIRWNGRVTRANPFLIGLFNGLLYRILFKHVVYGHDGDDETHQEISDELRGKVDDDEHDGGFSSFVVCSLLRTRAWWRA